MNFKKTTTDNENGNVRGHFSNPFITKNTNITSENPTFGKTVRIGTARGFDPPVGQDCWDNPRAQAFADLFDSDDDVNSDDDGNGDDTRSSTSNDAPMATVYRNTRHMCISADPRYSDRSLEVTSGRYKYYIYTKLYIYIIYI